MKLEPLKGFVSLEAKSTLKEELQMRRKCREILREQAESFQVNKNPYLERMPRRKYGNKEQSFYSEMLDQQNMPVDHGRAQLMLLKLHRASVENNALCLQTNSLLQNVSKEICVKLLFLMLVRCLKDADLHTKQ